MAAGAAGLAHRVGRWHLAAGGLFAAVLQGLGIAGGALATVVWTALIGFSLGGVAHGVKNVLLRTLIHERAPEPLCGRAFAAYNGARNGAELAALVLGGVAVSAFGARSALLAAGLGPAAIGLTCLLLLDGGGWDEGMSWLTSGGALAQRAAFRSAGTARTGRRSRCADLRYRRSAAACRRWH